MISTMMRTSRTEPTVVACVVPAAAWAEGGRTSKPFGAAELDAQAVLVAAAAVGDGEPSRTRSRPGYWSRSRQGCRLR